MNKLTILFCTLTMISCTSDFERYEKELSSCMSETKERLDANFASMDEAIAGLDFNLAHTFFSCYKEGSFYDGSGGYTSDCVSCVHPRRDAADRLAKAEVTYLSSLKEFDKAISVHDELIGSIKDKIEDGYISYDGILGADNRFQIIKNAVLHFLEEKDALNAIKWAKRAPTDVDARGIFIARFKEDDKQILSQQDELLKFIKEY